MLRIFGVQIADKISIPMHIDVLNLIKIFKEVFLMKIFSIVSLLTVLIIGITGCTSDIPQNLDNMPESLAAPDYYASIEDYENHQHQEM